MKAQNPNYTHFQIQNAILNTVDYKSSLSGKVVTEGRLNAFNAVTYLAPPTNLIATFGDGSVTLSWDANNENAMTGYKITYTKPSSTSTYLYVGNVTSYKVSGLSNGTRYNFVVRAIGNFPSVGVIEGPDSTSVSETPSGPGGRGNGGGGGGGGCFITTAAYGFRMSNKTLAIVFLIGLTLNVLLATRKRHQK